MSSSILLLAAYIVLTSGKPESATYLINKNEPFMKILNKMGPYMEPWVTPNRV